jgi:hypothetical protein
MVLEPLPSSKGVPVPKILANISPRGGEGSLTDVTWGEKYEKRERCVRKRKREKRKWENRS